MSYRLLKTIPRKVEFHRTTHTRQDNSGYSSDVNCYELRRRLTYNDPSSVSNATSDDPNVPSNLPNFHRKQRSRLIENLEKHFGRRLVTLRSDGCATLICFRENLPEVLKLVETREDEDQIEELARTISDEIRNRSNVKVKSYKLEDFTFEQTKANCNKKLLHLISTLISHGDVSKQSICLTQSIQALVTKSFNQTTLGIAVKLHHRFGSKEIINDLHGYGFIASYDEVLRFRKSAAKMTAEQDLTFRGLYNDMGLISSWFDNFDLQIYTPNGCRETHSMAIEFTQHLDGKCNPLSFATY